MRTLIEAEDSAEAVLFLASEAGRYITGMNLNVNAGTLIL
jgi:NAD(P)-dependent dehydrogenase (short-subunit alcohol dehydrogenase family)